MTEGTEHSKQTLWQRSGAGAKDDSGALHGASSIKRQTGGTGVVSLNSLWQNVIGFSLAIAWIVVVIVLYVRTYLKQRAYLRHFAHEYPYLAGEPLFDVPRTFRAYREVARLGRERQSDPELERLRREMWRRNRSYIIWLFGFPVLVIGVAALLIATGIVTVTSAEQQQPSGPEGSVVSRSVVEIVQIAGFVLALLGTLLVYAHYGRFVRILGTAVFMGALGFLAMQSGALPTGPWIPSLLFVVGCTVAMLVPPVRKVGSLTENQSRAIGFVLVFLGMLAAFFLPYVLPLYGVTFG